jgi:hypothetical protein
LAAAVAAEQVAADEFRLEVCEMYFCMISFIFFT